jgi:hypothetical protein
MQWPRFCQARQLSAPHSPARISYRPVGGAGLANLAAGIVGLIWMFFSWYTVRPSVQVDVHLNGNLIPDTSR